MTLDPSVAIKNLKRYLRKFNLQISEEAESIFRLTEDTGFRLNCNPLPAYFLYASLVKGEKLRFLIKETGADPDTTATRVLQEINRTCNPERDWYDQPKCLYSSPRRNDVRARLIDQVILAARRNNHTEIKEIDIIEALLEVHNAEFPSSENESWTTREIKTSYNTLSHIVGVYIDGLWIGIDEVRQGLQKFARLERQRDKIRLESGQLLKTFDKLVHLRDAQKRGYLLQDLLNGICRLHGIEVHESFIRNKGAEQIDGAFQIGGWHYLVECRWRKKVANVRELDGLLGQVTRSGKQTMGLFLSISGWSSNVPSMLKQNTEKSIILMDGNDLRNTLEPTLKVDLRDFVLAKAAKLNVEGEPFFGVSDYLKERTSA